MAPEIAPGGVVLRAAPGTVDVGSRRDFPGWLINGSLPSPLLRVRRGDVFSATLENALPEPLILHWHGMLTPEAMDGHPRLAVGTGRTYSYRFPVTDRAGCYWYHSHAHHRAGLHTYRGIAGLVIVHDPDEEVGLPSAERELPIILQDRRLDANGLPTYGLMGPAMMTGMMGDEPFANGVHRPYAEVDAAVYRLRLLNGSTARIFRLARSDGSPLILIGGDAGLLSTPASVPWLEIAPGERADVILDLRRAQVGDRIMLRSVEFDLGGMGGMPGMGGRGGRGGMMGMMAAANRQGAPIDLVELRVTRRTSDPGSVPERLPTAPVGPDPAESRRERRFVFRAAMMSHTVNGRSFELDRIDERVPFGDAEIWTFVNDSELPHPVHLHATHFRILERRGGRAEIMPWERGLKDTALLHPGETVRVAVSFIAHRGLFLLHCHNLEHEDQGMMLNILVE
jgi:FtsP/CotA-like multicopper oxidase with cupredoxin domain